MNFEIEYLKLRTQNAQLKGENVQLLQYCNYLEECLRKTQNKLSERMVEQTTGSTTNSKSSVNPFYRTRDADLDDTFESMDYQPSRLATTKDSIGHQNHDSSTISAICELSVDGSSSLSSSVFSNQTQAERCQEEASRELSAEILEKSININSKLSKKSIWSEPKISLVQNSQEQEPQPGIFTQSPSFGLCQVESQKKCTLKRHYVVEIQSETEDEKLGKIYKVTFFKTKMEYGETYRFLRYERDEDIFIYASDIVLRLPSPQVGRRNSYKFNQVDFSKFHMVMY